MTTLAQLIDTYGANAFVFCDAGNGCAFGQAGQTLDYDEAAAAKYGDLEMSETDPHKSEDGAECTFASDWISGNNGYSYQVRF